LGSLLEFRGICCMCSLTLSQQEALFPASESTAEFIPYGSVDENARHGMLCDRRHRDCRAIPRTLPVPRGRSLSSSLSRARIYAGYWDAASADWRICPTSFEPRRRADDGRLGPTAGAPAVPWAGRADGSNWSLRRMRQVLPARTTSPEAASSRQLPGSRPRSVVRGAGDGPQDDRPRQVRLTM